MPVDLPQTFVMSQSERHYRVPDTDARQSQLRKAKRSRGGVLFLFSVACFVAYPVAPPLFTPPARALLPHEQPDTPAP